MARHAEGWKVYYDDRYGVYYVRFTHAGQRVTRTTRQSDLGQAKKVAARLYAEVISGRRQTTIGFASSGEIDEAASLWLESLESSLDKRTVDSYGLYVSGLWQPCFQTIDQLTPLNIEDYWRDRLKVVQRNTVKKELSALRGFLRWCKESALISEVPQFSTPPMRAIGTRSKKVNPKPEPILITEDQALRLIEKLPETLQGRRSGKRYPVRARFVVAWETALRPATLDEISVPENYKKGAAILKLRSENDKARFARNVPLTDKARAALDAVCPKRGLIFGKHDYRPALKAACKAAKVPQVSPYDFRHSRLTHLVESSNNLAGIQYLAGHKHATTTAIYLKASQRAAEAVLDGLKNSGWPSHNSTPRRRK